MNHLLVILKQFFKFLGIGLRPVPQAKESRIDHGLLLKDSGPQFFDAALNFLQDVKD